MLHLRPGIEISEKDGANLLVGSFNGDYEIRQVCPMPRFYQSQGGKRAPITQDWIEASLVLRDGAAEINADKTQFARVTRGLITLLKGLKERSGQDRLHQFVRSLEALILPDKGETKKKSVDCCQTFVRAGRDPQALLREAFDMRSDTEHLHSWEKSVQGHPPDQRKDVWLAKDPANRASGL